MWLRVLLGWLGRVPKLLAQGFSHYQKHVKNILFEMKALSGNHSPSPSSYFLQIWKWISSVTVTTELTVWLHRNSAMASTSSLASTQSLAHHQNPVAVKYISDSISRVTREDNASSTNKAAIFQRLHPRVYLERFLAEDARPDGRSLGEMDSHTGSVISEGTIWREVSINVGMFCLPQISFLLYGSRERWMQSFSLSRARLW